jgi:hypothetical protein
VPISPTRDDDLAEAPVVRSAGLPVPALTSLRFERSWRHAAAVLAERERLAAEGRQLAVLLYDVVGRLTEPHSRGAVLALRRALHQGRRPARRVWNRAVEAHLPAALGPRVRDWVAHAELCADRAAELDELLAKECIEKETVLLEVVRDAGFRRALTASSPVLADELDKWMADPSRSVSGRLAPKLARYVARAAAKTSPYSSFTGSGFGAWADGGPAVRLHDSPRAAVVEVNALLVRAIEQAIADRPAAADRRSVRANSSLTRSAGQVRFLGARTGEPIVATTATPLLDRCLDLVGDGSATDVATLRRQVARLTPSSSAEAVGRFVDRLVDGGVLEARPPVADTAVDRLAGLVEWLGDDESDLAAAVRGLHEVIRRPAAVEDVDGHRRWRARAAPAVQRILTAVRDHLPSTAGPAPARAVLHENVLHTMPVASLSADCWQPALADLHVVRRWLAVVDPSAPLRLALAELWRDRLGAGGEQSFLDFHRIVQEARKDGAGAAAAAVRTFLRTDALLPSSPQAAASPIARIREFGELRRRELDRLGQAAGPDGVVRLGAGTVAGVVAGWPAWLRAPQSLSCYVQLRDGDPDARLVLNVAGTGYGRGRSRLAWLLAAGGVSARYTRRTDRSDGVLVAELGGTFDSAVNMRRPATAYEIDYPFTVSARPPGERIPLHDLVVRHDPGTDRLTLRSARLNAPVRPVHTGLMADFLLPPAARLLCLAFSDTHLLHPSIPLDSAFADPERIVHRPRVEIGRVVLRRAAWSVPAAVVPVRAAGETDGGYLLRLAGWLRSQGIPEQTYVRVPDQPGAEEPGPRAAIRAALSKARKPVRVDVADLFAVLNLERDLRAATGPVLFEEELPAPADAIAGPDGVPWVTEYLVEISEPGGTVG